MDKELEAIEKIIDGYEEKVRKVKLQILVFGPCEPPAHSSDNYHKTCYEKKLQIKRYLRQEGHTVFFPEECLRRAQEKGGNYNPESFEEYLISNSHITILLRTSFGATMEFGRFSQVKGVKHKLYVLRDISHQNGYAQQGPDSILQAEQVVTGEAQPIIQDFTPEELQECKVVSVHVKDIVSKIQQVSINHSYRKY